jgi:NADH:ubiquinone oxidoreductase subunit 2 (subunit N)
LTFYFPLFLSYATYFFIAVGLLTSIVFTFYTYMEVEIFSFLVGSSLVNMGFFLLMLPLLADNSLFLFYFASLTAYLLSIFPFFILFLSIRREDGEYCTSVTELFHIRGGLFKALLLLYFLAFSGIPPFLLFFSKFFILSSLLVMNL